MKSKLLIMGVLCAVAFAANAQTEKGKNFINGSVGYRSANYGGESSNSGIIANNGDSSKILTIMPRFGHFFGKNFAIGIGIGYNNTQSKYGSNNFSGNNIVYSLQTNKQHSFNVGPFVRYYVDVADKFKFFGQLNTSIGFGKSDQSNSYVSYNLISSSAPVSYSTANSNYKFTTYSASLNPGFAFFPSKRWAVEFSFPLLDYTKLKPKEQVASSNTYVQTTETFTFLTSSFNPSLGFNFHF